MRRIQKTLPSSSSIIAPAGEEGGTKLTFIGFESLCYVNAFILFC